MAEDKKATTTPVKAALAPGLNAGAKEWTPTPAALAATTPGASSQTGGADASEGARSRTGSGSSAQEPAANGSAEAAAAGDEATGAQQEESQLAAAAVTAQEPEDDATTKRLYDIARLLSLRPTEAQPPRPPELNPPPDLNILWDGSLDVPAGSLSARSLGSAMSGGGSGFTTPRGDPGSRTSGRSFGAGDRSNSSRGGGLPRQSSRDHMGGGGGGGGGRRDNRSNGRRGPVDTAPPLEDCEPLQVNEGTRWKAKHMLADEEAAKLEAAAEDPDVVMRRAIALLNKMTLEKFDKLSAAFVEVGFTTEDLVNRIIAVLVEKAQMEAHFAAMYAKLCLRLSESPLPAFRDAKNGPKMFRKMLLEHCQEEFVKDTGAIIQQIKEDANLTPEEKAEKELIVRRRYTGHMRFIGELYKVGLLKEKYVHLSIEELLGMNQEDGTNVMPDEEKLECMVRLMITVGRQMEQTASTAEYVKNFKRYFKRIKKLSEDMDNVSSRLRFMLRDLVELRNNDWVPRRQEEKAKTIAQIHSEVAREEEAKARKAGGDPRRGGGGGGLSSRPSSSGLSGGSQDARAGSNRYIPPGTAPPPAPADDGWETVGKGRKGGGNEGWSAPAKLAKSTSMKSTSAAPPKPQRAASQSGFAVLAGADERSSSSKRSSSSSKHKDKDASSKSGKEKKDKKDRGDKGDKGGGKFRRRRLTYAAQHAVSSNKLPMEAEGSGLYRAQEMGEEARVPPMPPAMLGVYSCHGIEPGWEDTEGTAVAKINQDRGCITYPFMGSPTSALLCVFDGHGEQGDAVSNFAMKEMAVRLSGHADIARDPAKALKSCFMAINKALRSLPDSAAVYSGSTAVVILVRDNRMWVANAGDSRAVLATEAAGGAAAGGARAQSRLQVVALTHDHDPDLPLEKARIESSGGFVSPPAEAGLSARVWLDPEMTQVGLAMARSLGDLAVKTVGVIAEPEVIEHTIAPSDQFLVMASDGVWEFLSSEEVVALVQEHLVRGGDRAARGACEALIARAANKWRTHEGDYRDDITAIILTLPWFPPHAAAAGHAT